MKKSLRNCGAAGKAANIQQHISPCESHVAYVRAALYEEHAPA